MKPLAIRLPSGLFPQALLRLADLRSMPKAIQDTRLLAIVTV